MHRLCHPVHARAAVLLALAAILLAAPTVALGSPQQVPGAFFFSRANALPGEQVVIRTASPGYFRSRDRVQLFLVPESLAKRVKSPKDKRALSVGHVRIVKSGRGVLRVTLPDVPPGSYVLARSCPSCSKRANRPFKVLLPPSTASSEVRGRMLLQVDNPYRLCDATHSEKALRDFFLAFDRGEPKLVGRFFTDEDRWIWWRDPENMQQPVEFAQLESYLRSIQERGVTLSLDSLRFTGFRASPRLGEFSFRLARAGVAAGNGKGAVDCKTGRLALVTIDRW